MHFASSKAAFLGCVIPRNLCNFSWAFASLGVHDETLLQNVTGEAHERFLAGESPRRVVGWSSDLEGFPHGEWCHKPRQGRYTTDFFDGFTKVTSCDQFPRNW